MKKIAMGFLGLALSVSASSFALINGTLPVDSDPHPFPNTVHIRYKSGHAAFCTASRIGSKTFLTAAHCVFDPSTRTLSRISRGMKIQWTNEANPQTVLGDPDAGWTDATVDDVYINPEVWDKCQPGACDNIYDKAPDVAVIRLLETPELRNSSGVVVSPAYVDFTHAATGNSVVMTGYGCESYAGPDPFPAGNARLKYGSTIIVGNDIFSWFPFWRPSEDVTFYSAGNALIPGAPSGCPGDSGGPVYRDDGVRNNIVGVISRGSWDPLTGQGKVNFFARVESLATWIRDVNL